MDWIEASQRGESPDIPAPGYRWNETRRLNADIAATASEEAYDDILEHLDDGLARVLNALVSLGDSELLDVGVFGWAGKPGQRPRSPRSPPKTG